MARVCACVAIGIIGWLAWPVVTGAQAPPISGQDVRTFDLVYETEVHDIPSGAARVDVWIPLPQDDLYQDIITQRVDTPHGWTIHTEPEYGNKILHLGLADADVRTIPITLRFRVRRREHVQPLLSGDAVPVRPNQRWLQPDRLVPLDERIRSIAIEVTHDAETPLEKARGDLRLRCRHHGVRQERHRMGIRRHLLGVRRQDRQLHRLPRAVRWV